MAGIAVYLEMPQYECYNACFMLKIKRVTAHAVNHLEKLENQSVYILREAYANFKNLAMLWSIGKDSTVLLWLARKAFFGHVPFPLVHIDTSYKFRK